VPTEIRGDTPRTLKPRHKLIALMSASGHSTVQIAAELGMSSQGVYAALKSPLMRALVAQYLQQIEARTQTSVADVLSTLRGETAKTLKTIVDIRDTGVKEDSVRLSAAIELFDRQVPKVHKTDESKTVRIVLDGERLARLGAVVTEGTAPRVIEHRPAVTPVAPLDDVIARYAAAEAAAEGSD
jgi:hypothetical protein